MGTSRNLRGTFERPSWGLRENFRSADETVSHQVQVPLPPQVQAPAQEPAQVQAQIPAPCRSPVRLLRVPAPVLVLVCPFPLARHAGDAGGFKGYRRCRRPHGCCCFVLFVFCCCCCFLLLLLLLLLFHVIVVAVAVAAGIAVAVVSCCCCCCWCCCC